MNKNNKGKMTLETTVVQAGDVVSEELGTEVVMLRLVSNAYYSTNDIGAEIWKRIKHPIRVSDLVNDLIQVYEVDGNQCAQDVLRFLNDAYSEGTVAIV
jgi:hypothetical protein